MEKPYLPIEFRDTCPNPAGSVLKRDIAYEFILTHGDVGGCEVDKQSRDDAAYWERAELRGEDLAKGRKYRFNFELKFDSNTASSDRTTFFQIHQYNRFTKTKVPPAFMLKANADRSTTADVLKTDRSRKKSVLGLKREHLSNRWCSISVNLSSTNGLNPITVYMNDQEIFSDKTFIDPEGSLFIKAGLYRPGSIEFELPLDRIWIRNIEYADVTPQSD